MSVLDLDRRTIEDTISCLVHGPDSIGRLRTYAAGVTDIDDDTGRSILVPPAVTVRFANGDTETTACYSERHHLGRVGIRNRRHTKGGAMSCPSCGTTDEPVRSVQRVRDYLDRPQTITFYTCRQRDCRFSSWDHGEWVWDETIGTDPSEISVASDRAK